MTPTFYVQKAQSKLFKVSLILGFISLLAALFFHFFLYFFPGILQNTILVVLVSTPFVIGIISIIIVMISLRKIMAINLAGPGKVRAIAGIVLGCAAITYLVIFLFYLFSKI